MRRLSRPSRSPRRDERGAVAVVVAVATVALAVAAAMVVDFGVIRLDRQLDKLAADSAVSAGMDAATDTANPGVYSSRAVCAAVDFLRANRPELAGLATCTTLGSKTCSSADPDQYDGTTTVGGKTFEVRVRMPYRVTDTVGGGAFPEESLGTLSGDPGDTRVSGCDQLGIVIRQTNRLGLGRVVSDSDLVTRVRSVGRISQPGEQAPALVLLERSKCSVLTIGSSGSPSRVKVFGAGTAPGMIHSDSAATGTDCGSGSNQPLFQGSQAGGIIAYGAGGAPGSITSVATLRGVSGAVIADSTANVFGTASTADPTSGAQVPVAGRRIVTRTLVDQRYADGVRSAISAASSVWSLDPAAPGPGWTRVGCNPTTAQLSPPTPGLYIDCPGTVGISVASGTITATRVFLNGHVKGGRLVMPNATDVYVNNTNSATGAPVDTGGVKLASSTDCFAIGTSSCTDAPLAQCSASPSTARARLFLRQGSLTQSSGTLRMCNTTGYLLGGQASTGCLPVDNSGTTAPSMTPCGGASGSGQLSATGGVMDWTAPNRVTTPSTLLPSARQALWDDGEDLAMWSESYGGSTGNGFAFRGNSSTRVTGVYMAPNAAPFRIGGNGAQEMVNAQFVVAAFGLGGAATLTMTVDPDSAVPLPRTSLVR